MPKRTRKPSKRQQERQDARPFPHRTGRWAKKARGRFVYLGKVSDDPTGEAAWNKWLEIRDDVRAGRTPRPKVEGLTVKDLVNRWLTAKQRKLDSGELTLHTMNNYRNVTDLLMGELDANRLVDDLDPSDFQKLRAAMAKRWGPVRLGVTIAYVRGIFKFAFENGLIDRPVRFGSEFTRPAAKTIRKARNGHAPRMFQPQQLRDMLDAADPVAKVMLLLGFNCAMGNSDLVVLPMRAVDLETGWLAYPRGKTGIDRRIPLWDETVAAVEAVLGKRPKAKPGCAKFLLLKSNGAPWSVSSVQSIYGRIAGKAKVEGRSFYDLRRTFQTIGEESRDLAAVQAIMGHAARSDDMSAIYRQRVSDERLRAVVGVVHDWLFPEVAIAATV